MSSRHHPLPTLDRPQPVELDADSDSGSRPETDHLDDIEVAQLEQAAGGEAPPAPDGLPIGADGLLSVEAFAGGRKHALTLAGHLTALQTLLASPEAPTYPDAATAIYESIRAVPALHFLIRPGGLWLQRAAAIAVWAVPVGAGVRAELAERRRQAVPGPESSETAA